MADPRWPQAVAEAVILWSSGSILEARRSLLAQARAGDTTLAMWLLERVHPAFQRAAANRSQPPRQVQVVVVGKDIREATGSR
jgi:hypothetical protein